MQNVREFEAFLQLIDAVLSGPQWFCLFHLEKFSLMVCLPSDIVGVFFCHVFKKLLRQMERRPALTGYSAGAHSDCSWARLQPGAELLLGLSCWVSAGSA